MKEEIRIDTDFDGGSAGAIRRTGPDSYTVEPLPEGVAEWFNEALERHFGGAGVRHIQVLMSYEVP